MRRLILILLCLLPPPPARAAIFAQVHGIVHDPQHRPITNATVTLHAVHSSFARTTTTAPDGSFALPSIPLGDYTITASAPGFAASTQTLTLASNTSPILHFELQLAAVTQSVSVDSTLSSANIDTATPTTLIDRETISQTPGASRTGSLAMVTDFVPGAYITHDMLHMRGGHQVSWMLDGVEIPNTNIASNLGAQIDPKDIDYLEIQRGSYTADLGDRTYGVFNVVPRNGFERDRQAELVLAAGNFVQASAQLSLGDHTRDLAWYASLTASRSDFGLAPPIGRVFHDSSDSFGVFTSTEYNKTSKDQLRLVSQFRSDFFQIPDDPNAADYENQLYDSSALRDTQRETDALAAFSWLRTFNLSTVLQLSPFFHFNQADYTPNPGDQPVTSSVNRASTYAGGQASITSTIARNTLQAGLYSFGQHDAYLFAAIFNDGSASSFRTPDSASGGVVEVYFSDNFKLTSWLTLIAGLRQTHFQASFNEEASAPRGGLALRVPRLNWVFRAAYDRFYQPPPLLTAKGPIVDFASANNTGFAPLHGERDEEHQFGVSIPGAGPLRGWLLDVDTFHNRVSNFLDHSNIGESSLYFPVTVQGALIRAWETTLRSPAAWRFGQFHLAYSNQIAEQRGPITGGLICTPIGDPACDAGYTYTPLDHDQRNTLDLGVNARLPRRITAATNIYYGSGFHNGFAAADTPYPNAYLSPHTTLDLTLARSFSENLSLSVTALNAANRRLLLDNSLTFGGFHFNDPRQLYGELRYRFHF